MDQDTLLRVRRAVMALTAKENGQSVLIRCDTSAAQQISAEVHRFARSRDLGVALADEDAGVRVTRDDSRKGAPASRYAPMDGLEVGDSHVFEVPLEDHYKVRQAASTRMKTSAGKKFRCEREGNGIRVTRLPDDATISAGRPRRHSINLAALDTHQAVAFAGYDMHSAVRTAASQWAYRHNWVLHTRIVGDTITVYRLDNLEVFRGIDQVNTGLNQILAASAG
jgi:hypothetical protein